MQSLWVRSKVKLNNHLQWIEIHCRNMNRPDGTVKEYSQKVKSKSQQKSNYFIGVEIANFQDFEALITSISQRQSITKSHQLEQSHTVRLQSNRMNKESLKKSHWLDRYKSLPLIIN